LLIDVLGFTIYDSLVIPLNLKLSGFLSYRDPVEVDFSGFDLACISGSNGAGKSSLLDAITWALFGQARKRDEALINLQSKVAEVAFTFAYETNVYRVIRALARGKTTTLEFQIADDSPQTIDHDHGRSSMVNGHPHTWRPLTERTLRDTQARIEQILRLDYETFVNVSFFLQGRADQFAQQPPTRRKEILGNILGLEAWEVYRERAAERRKNVEHELNSVDGRVAEIEAELAEEEPRKAHLVELESQLKGLAESRKLQEAALANVKQVQAALDRQRDLVRKLGEALELAQANLTGFQARLALKESESSSHAELSERGPAIEATYASLLKARLDLEKWEQVAERFREHDQRRQPLLREIESERARLEQEKLGLEEQCLAIGNQAAAAGGSQLELAATRQALEQAELQLTRRLALQKLIQEQREKQAELRAENVNLRTKMNEFDERKKKLAAAEGVVCPLCGQLLSPEHRQSTLEQLQLEGGQLGDRWRANKSVMDELALQISDQETQFTKSGSADNERLNASNAVAQLSERLESFAKQSGEWEQSGSKRLV
jgi:DNA repair protein SbcC/Rad50